MEIEKINEISRLKQKGVTPVYSIWIVHEEQDDNTFDVSVWDEIENERVHEMEESRFENMDEAEKALNRIIKDNPRIKFVRLKNVKN